MKLLKKYEREDDRLMFSRQRILTEKKGISLISLIITIIVIIILAAIVIFTGLGTPNSANFAKFASEFSDFNLAVDNAYMKEFTDNALNNQTRSKRQVYYKLATGVDVGMSGETVPAGYVSGLGEILPEGLEGNEYYLVTDDRNVEGWTKQKQYFEATEKHYITDEGEAFFLPGYLMEEEGTQKWWINERKYYIGEKKLGSGEAGGGAGEVATTLTGTDGSVVNVLTSSEIDALRNANLKNSSVKMVVKADADTGVVPIPTGFDYLEGTEQDGLVIKDSRDNEFVWIPVSYVTTMYDEGEAVSLDHASTPNVTTTTTRWGKSMPLPNSKSGFREPAILSSSSYDKNTTNLSKAGFSTLQAFADDMATEFNNMIESVGKYGGFYVGRYELGYDSGVVCRKGVSVLTASTSSGTNYYGSSETSTWYGLYKACKSFTSGGAKSSMIWGCQWDAMVNFIGNHTATAPGSRYPTGADAYNDKAKNVYDTSTGGVSERTATADDILHRASRGGDYYDASSASRYLVSFPTSTSIYNGTRVQLYIK